MECNQETHSVKDKEDLSASQVASRRKFLKIAVALLAGINGLVLGLPFVKTLISKPSSRKAQFTKLKDLGSIPVGVPVDIKFKVVKQDAFYRNEVLRMAWVIKSEDGSVNVYSPVCPHLGCYFTWNPKAGEFQCPCHASTFSKDGTVLGGPAPRPLDTLPHKVEGNTLFVQWVDYKPGTAQKEVV